MNVVSNQCAHDGCHKTSPVFNTAGSPNGLYCAAHKLEGMVDVKNKRCAHDGCDTRASCNMPGEVQGLYCATHKLDGMVDVQHKQ